MNEQTSLLAIEKEKEREKKERNVLAIARNMNNYIQRAECRIRAKNVAISLKFAKYPNIAFVLRLPVCQYASIFLESVYLCTQANT